MVSAPATSLSSSKPSHTAHEFRIRRVPGIDGLRGLAVSSVVLYHFFGNLIHGGYLGVDIFFVLSGFLITSLLIRERAVSGRIHLKQFWLRRLRRIVPAAVTVLVVITIVAGAIGSDPAVGLPTQFFGTLFFANNWVQITGAKSYFADTGVQVFAHYWSLAVEEQFYLLWPLIFVGLTHLRISRKWLSRICLGGAVLSLLLMVLRFTPGTDPTPVYYGTHTHAFGLLIGAGVACVLTSSSGDRDADSWPVGTFSPAYRRALSLISPVALVLLLLLVWRMSDTAAITYRGGLFAGSILTALVLTRVVLRIGVVPRIFDLSPLHWLGRISFSLYLWHWPVVVLAKELDQRISSDHHTVGAGVMSLLLSLLLASLSYMYVETPIRRHGYVAVASHLINGQHAAVTNPTDADPANDRSMEPGGTVAAKGSSRALRFAAVATTSVALCAATAVALHTSPTKTRLELDLERLAAQQAQLAKQEQAKADAHASPGTAPPEYRQMPDGENITALGDSVMLASSAALTDEFPGIYIDARVSAHYQQIYRVLQQMDAEGTLDPFVILGLGTNGPASGAYEGLMDDILNLIGPHRVLVLVLPYGDRWYMPEAEKEVLDVATQHPNVYVADWCHAVRDDVSQLRGDLIHPEPPGAVRYAQQVRTALVQWAHNKKSVPGACGV